MTEVKDETKKEADVEEQRIRDRIKSRQESRRHRSQSNPDEDLTTQQKRRGRRRRRERRRQHREAARVNMNAAGPPSNRNFGRPAYHGPDAPRWERSGPSPHMRGFQGDDYWRRRDLPPPPPRAPGPRPPFDEYHRGRPPARRDERYQRNRSYSRSRSRSRSDSRSVSPSTSRSRSSSSSTSRSRSDDSRSLSRSPSVHRGRRRRSRSYSRSRSRSADKNVPAKVPDRGRRSSESASVSGSDESSQGEPEPIDPDAELTKDQRTVFVSQLVMRAEDRDIRRYFRRKVGCKVNEVILLRDKRTGRHKGCAYVELGRLEDVGKAVQVNGQAPDFQRFPILVKASEAEKNYTIPSSSSTLTASMMGISAPVVTGPLVGPHGKLLEAQKAYVGNLDRRITQEQVFALFSPFGQLDKVMLQMEPGTGVSKGFAFLSFRDPKDANLAIQTMAGQMLAGRPLKTGWANQTSTIPNVEVVTSYEFPDDAPVRIQNAHVVLAQLTGSGLAGIESATATLPIAQIASTAEAAIDAALGLPVDASAFRSVAVAAPPIDARVIGGADAPTRHLLVHNMFNKDEETEDGWEEDIRLDFLDECAKYGKISSVVVMSKEPGGKIYASFETVDGAKTCASNLAGRWFDKRQLRVEFVQEDAVPTKQG